MRRPDLGRSLVRLERTAALLRRSGLGRFVDAAKRLIAPRFGSLVPAYVPIDGGLRMKGASIGHIRALRAWADGAEEAWMSELFKSEVTPSAMVLDVGAHLGYYTLLAGRAAGPTGGVYAVEPNPDTRHILERNVDLNDMRDRVTVIPVAFSDRNGPATFYPDTDDASRSGLAPHDAAPGKSVEVETRTANSYFGADVTFSVVKMDVEGAEVRALRGMNELLDDETVTLFIECNRESLKRNGTSAEELHQLLVDLGFRAAMIDEADRSIRPIESASELPAEKVNLICRRMQCE
jgi:FkbM family methyltransferase